MIKKQNYGQRTKAVRSGYQPGVMADHSEPLSITSSFVFANAADAQASFSGELDAPVYSRFSNPTVANFERKLADMEGGEACMATASGMAALLGLCHACLQQGDHIVASTAIFGASRILLDNHWRKFGIDIDFVCLTDLQAWEQALQKNTKLVFFETPANPLTEVADIGAIVELVRSYAPDCLVVVDNCFCTPVLQTPLSYGADAVLHSTTKFIDGQGRCLGGAIVGSEELIEGKLRAFMRTAGPCMSPFNAWVFSKGLETLHVRMQASCDSAQQVADWLEQHPSVERVYYPGLQSHPQYDLAVKQQSRAGAVLSFAVKGGRTDAWQIIDSTQLLSITANLGDTRSTITHPYTTTHARWTDEQKIEVGISENLIRLSIGLEGVQDIIADLKF